MHSIYTLLPTLMKRLKRFQRGCLRAPAVRSTSTVPSPHPCSTHRLYRKAILPLWLFPFIDCTVKPSHSFHYSPFPPHSKGIVQYRSYTFSNTISNTGANTFSNTIT